MIAEGEKMTSKQKENYNRMRAVLIQIWKHYQSPDQLRRNSGKEYGLDYEEALEMAYENMQQTAKEAVRGVRGL